MGQNRRKIWRDDCKEQDWLLEKLGTTRMATVPSLHHRGRRPCWTCHNQYSNASAANQRIILFIARALLFFWNQNAPLHKLLFIREIQQTNSFRCCGQMYIIIVVDCVFGVIFFFHWNYTVNEIVATGAKNKNRRHKQNVSARKLIN